MQPFRFLSFLSDDNWQGPVRTFLLITLGPQSRDALYTRLGQLQAHGGSLLEVAAGELADFSVQALPVDHAGGSCVRHLCELAFDDPNPCAVSLTEEPEVMRLAAEALPVGRLLLSRQGLLQIELRLPAMFDGQRTLAVAGTLDVRELEEEFRIAF